jgi:hypothetical protein
MLLLFPQTLGFLENVDCASVRGEGYKDLSSSASSLSPHHHPSSFYQKSSRVLAWLCLLLFLHLCSKSIETKKDKSIKICVWRTLFFQINIIPFPWLSSSVFAHSENRKAAKVCPGCCALKKPGDGPMFCAVSVLHKMFFTMPHVLRSKSTRHASCSCSKKIYQILTTKHMLPSLF